MKERVMGGNRQVAAPTEYLKNYALPVLFSLFA